MHANLINKFSESEQMASMEIHVKKRSDNFTAIETENTLSNVTSIQSQLQSLYDCNDSLKTCDKYNNYRNINLNNSTDKLVYLHASNINDNANTQHIRNKSLGGNVVGSSTNLKKSLETQKHQIPELETKTNNTTHSELKSNLSSHMLTKPSANESILEQSDSNKSTAFAAGKPVSTGLNNTKTATILVSKTKTKTGLPLLLKNSIN